MCTQLSIQGNYSEVGSRCLLPWFIIYLAKSRKIKNFPPAAAKTVFYIIMYMYIEKHNCTSEVYITKGSSQYIIIQIWYINSDFFG